MNPVVDKISTTRFTHLRSLSVHQVFWLKKKLSTIKLMNWKNLDVLTINSAAFPQDGNQITSTAKLLSTVAHDTPNKITHITISFFLAANERPLGILNIEEAFIIAIFLIIEIVVNYDNQ